MKPVSVDPVEAYINRIWKA